MKILVTGGAGYVGSHVCKRLRADGISHLVLDDFSTGHATHLQRSPYAACDIADAAGVDAWVGRFRPDVIIHLAAIATIPGCASDPERTRAVNIDGMHHLLDAMVNHKVKAIVFASSCAVYADSPTPRPYVETDAVQPPTLYGETKLAGETLLKEYQSRHGIAYAAFRIFNVAGADPEGVIGEDHEPETHLLPLILKAALTGKPLALYGNDYSTPDGTAVRDYVHVCDIADAMALAARRLLSASDAAIVNMASGTPTSVLELIAAVERVIRGAVPYTIAPRRQGDAPYLLGNPAALKEWLDFSPPRSDLASIIASAYRWHGRLLAT